MTEPCEQGEKFLNIEKRISSLETSMETVKDDIKSSRDDLKGNSEKLTRIETLLETKLGDKGSLQKHLTDLKSGQTSMKKSMYGNGKPGIATQVDRLNQWAGTVKKLSWILVTAVISLAIKVLFF